MCTIIWSVSMIKNRDCGERSRWTEFKSFFSSVLEQLENVNQRKNSCFQEDCQPKERQMFFFFFRFKVHSFPPLTMFPFFLIYITWTRVHHAWQQKSGGPLRVRIFCYSIPFEPLSNFLLLLLQEQKEKEGREWKETENCETCVANRAIALHVHCVPWMGSPEYHSFDGSHVECSCVCFIPFCV